MAYYFDYFKSLKYTYEQSISLYNIHFRVSSGGGEGGGVFVPVFGLLQYFLESEPKKKKIYIYIYIPLFFFWGGGLKEANLSTLILTKTNKSVESSV